MNQINEYVETEVTLPGGMSVEEFEECMDIIYGKRTSETIAKP